MTDSKRESERTDEGVDRRTMLKGTAVAGLAGAGVTGTAGAQSWKELRFKAAGEARFEYRVSVSGKLERAPNRDGYDTLVDENTGEGAASKGRFDDWLFTGEITELKLSGPGMVIVDGKVIEDTTKDDDKDDELPNTITIESKGKEVDYKFRVSGHVEKGDEAGANDDVIGGDTVRGTVGEDVNGGDKVDTYEFSGSIAFDRADGPLSVSMEIDEI